MKTLKEIKAEFLSKKQAVLMQTVKVRLVEVCKEIIEKLPFTDRIYIDFRNTLDGDVLWFVDDDGDVMVEIPKDLTMSEIKDFLTHDEFFKDCMILSGTYLIIDL